MGGLRVTPHHSPGYPQSLNNESLDILKSRTGQYEMNSPGTRNSHILPKLTSLSLSPKSVQAQSSPAQPSPKNQKVKAMAKGPGLDFIKSIKA